MRNSTSFFIALILSILGLAIFYYKYSELKFPLTPSEEYESWYVEARLDYRSDWTFKSDIEGDPTAQPVRVQMYLPREQSTIATIEEQTPAVGYGVEIDQDDLQNRIATFTKRKADRNELIFYRGIFYKLDSPAETTVPAEKPVAESPYKKSKRPALLENEQPDPLYTAIDSIIDEARGKAADKRSLIKALALAVHNLDERGVLIMNRAENAETQASLLVLLLNTANVPARLVHGLSLETQQSDLHFQDWAEVWYADKWNPIELETQRMGFKQPHLAWWVGHNPPYYIEGGRDAKLSLSVKKNTDNALQRAIWQSEEKASTLVKFSLFTLPIGTQLLFQIMLMIPLGGLIIAFLRQIVGVKTFGTFMPVLVALAFRETGLIAGVFVFCLIVFLGLVIRGWFHKLQLLMVPRLAAVLTIVVGIICFIALMAQNLKLTVGLSLSLFPIVVLTMTIERMSTMWDESGPREATSVGLGSLISAIACYYVLTSETLTHLLFTFPELLLIVLALSILLGRYNGYKLSEYFRFRKLEKRISEKKDAKGKA